MYIPNGYWLNWPERIDGIEWSIVNWDLYNPETHELVEKKEAKIKRLNNELSSNEETIKLIDGQILDFSKKKSDLIVDNNKIKEELDGLK